MPYKPKCPHEDNTTYQKLIQIDGCPQYEVKCESCGKLGIIYLIEGDEDWECRNKTNNTQKHINRIIYNGNTN